MPRGFRSFLFHGERKIEAILNVTIETFLMSLKCDFNSQPSRIVCRQREFAGISIAEEATNGRAGKYFFAVCPQN